MCMLGSDVITNISDDNCIYYFGCETENGDILCNSSRSVYIILGTY
jgi:hypothetical protein